jgi:hypothetical protein
MRGDGNRKEDEDNDCIVYLYQSVYLHYIAWIHDGSVCICSIHVVLEKAMVEKVL